MHIATPESVYFTISHTMFECHLTGENLKLHISQCSASSDMMKGMTTVHGL